MNTYIISVENIDCKLTIEVNAESQDDAIEKAYIQCDLLATGTQFIDEKDVLIKEKG